MKEEILQSAMTYIDGDKMPSAMNYIKADEKKEVSPENRIYIILYFADIDDEEIKSFEVVKGRKETYEFVKSIVEYTDLDGSKVITDGVDYEESLSVYEFMKAMENYFDDSFDIEDYVL